MDVGAGQFRTRPEDNELYLRTLFLQFVNFIVPDFLPFNTTSAFLCNGHRPVDIQCRTNTTGAPWWEAGEYLQVPCFPDSGLYCYDATQDDGICENYEVRYLCPSGKID